MIDPALLQLLQPPLPPELPRIAIERVWLSSAAEQAKRSADHLIRDSEERLAAWKRRVAELKSSIALNAPTEMLSSDERSQFDDLIADFEVAAEKQAIQAARLEKRAKRDTKRQFQIDPSLAAVTRDFGNSLLAMSREIIEETLDYALFLRAFRSERVPEARGGRAFDVADELERYLDAELS